MTLLGLLEALLPFECRSRPGNRLRWRDRRNRDSPLPTPSNGQPRRVGAGLGRPPCARRRHASAPRCHCGSSPGAHHGSCVSRLSGGADGRRCQDFGGFVASSAQNWEVGSEEQHPARRTAGRLLSRTQPSSPSSSSSARRRALRHARAIRVGLFTSGRRRHQERQAPPARAARRLAGTPPAP